MLSWDCAQGPPKVYTVEVACGFLGNDEPCKEMVTVTGNIYGAFYLVSGSIISYFYHVPHCILTITSQGRALSWKKDVESKIFSVKEYILMKVLDSHEGEIIFKCLRIRDSQSPMLFPLGG